MAAEQKRCASAVAPSVVITGLRTGPLGAAGTSGCGGDFRVSNRARKCTKTQRPPLNAPRRRMLKGSLARRQARGPAVLTTWHHQALVAPPHSHSHDGRGRRDDCSGGCAGQVVALGDGALLTNGPVTNGPVGEGPSEDGPSEEGPEPSAGSTGCLGRLRRSGPRCETRLRARETNAQGVAGPTWAIIVLVTKCDLGRGLACLAGCPRFCMRDLDRRR